MPPTQEPRANSLRAERLARGLAAAHELFKRGKFDQAEAACLDLQASEGSDPDILTLLGTVTIERGDPQGSIRYFEDAVTLAPDAARLHNNLGIAFKRAGRLDAAEAAYRRALAIDAAYAQAYNNLGVVLIERDNLAEAVRCFEAATNLDETYFEARRNLGRALLESNQVERANTEFRRMLETSPNDIGANLSLGAIERQAGHFQEAQSHLQRVLDLEPDHADALYQKGLVLQDQGALPEALAVFERVLALNSTHAGACNSLGVVSQALGNLGGAVQYFRRAISAQPEFAEAHRNLAFARRHAEMDDDARRTQALLETELDDASAMHVSFALSKIYDDLDQYDQAFGHLSQANELKRRSIDYDIGQERNFFANLERTFVSSFFEDRTDWGIGDRTPIFIVGMPRSGTTLVEQIIASHPRAGGAGEILDLDRLLWDCGTDERERDWCQAMNSLSRSQIDDLSASYLEGLRKRFPDMDHVTDKTLGNFHYIGMIRVMLPEAKVINCTRDPVDTCFSCYQNYFTQGVPFSYSLEDLGNYYRLYSNLMKHWRRQLPGFVYDLSYESLLNDLEGESKKLLAFCGLEWNPACLNFHKTERPVETASAVQVRQPIYRSSIARAAHYRSHLAPLREALGDVA